MKNFYEILEVPEDATQDQIRDAYKAKVKEYHPDHGGDSDKFINIVEAYETLGDEKKRKDYDQAGKVKKDKNINNVANRVIQTYFKKFLEAGGKFWKINVIKEIRKLLAIDEQRNIKEQQKINKKIRFLEDIKARIERSGKNSSSPIEELLTAEIEECHKRLRQTRFQTLVNEIIIQILNDYNLRRDVDA